VLVATVSEAQGPPRAWGPRQTATLKASSGFTIHWDTVYTTCWDQNAIPSSKLILYLVGESTAIRTEVYSNNYTIWFTCNRTFKIFIACNWI